MTTREIKNIKIVGIGASAGGLEAVEELLRKLPADTGATFVIVQHLSPRHVSTMDELIGKFTPMPVAFVNEIVTPRPNHVYLIAHDKNIIYERGFLKATFRDPDELPNRPIDVFFQTIGEELGERAIAVILSGAGADGTRGARTIKEKGGIVLVQDPASALFDGMPRAVIQLEIADAVLPPAALADKLIHLLGAAAKLPPRLDLQREADKNGARRILEQVSLASGIDFGDYRETTLARRLEKRMLLRQLTSLREYNDYLEEDELEIGALYKDFLIGVTSFFRDPEAFNMLYEKVLPNFFINIDKEQPIRIWVPACSTGEEAYSIAMLLSRYCMKHGIPQHFKVFASDVDKAAIHYAGEGIYPKSIAVDVPPDMLADYFQLEGEYYRVRTEIRDKILFAVQNVLSDPPFIHMSLISCRNFLIYLNPSAQRRVLTTFHFALEPEGYLFLGPSEALGEVKNAYAQVVKRWNIYQRRDDARLPLATPTSRLHGAGKATDKRPKAEPPALPAKLEEFHDPFTRYLVDRFTPTALFFNREYDILYFNGDVDRFLSIPRAIARFSIDKMTNSEVARLFKKGIDDALAAAGVRLYEGIAFEKPGSKETTNLRFQKVDLQDIDDPIVLVEILPSHNGHDAGQAPPTEEEISQTRYLQEKVQYLERELYGARRQTKQLLGELETINEELHASNRELMVANEELQSTNEELQSINEELHTVNAELQAKNQQLTSANKELTKARGQLVERLNQEKAHLENALAEYKSFMNHARHQIALVDRNGIIHHLNYAQYTGKSVEELIGTSFFGYLAEEYRRKIEKAIDHIFRGEAYSEVNFNYTRPDGGQVQVRLIATPVILDEHVKYVALIGYQE